ncbi:MAG: hypothetical protein ABH833_02140 [Parcubacteria group bacterium]
MKDFHHSKNSGIALISAVLMVGILLGIAFTVSGIFIPKMKASSESRKSVTALYAAESGAEWCIYVRNHDPDPDAPSMGNNSDYYDKNGNTLGVDDCNSMPIKVLGEFKGVTRAFELAY